MAILEHGCGRRRSSAYSVALLCAFLALPVHGQSQLRDSLATAFSSLPHSQTRAGACVIDISSGAVVFASGADQPLIPASSIKVATMAVALSELGPDFVFKTILATDGRNLIVVGDGDPALGDSRLHRIRNEAITSDFQRWADALRARGTMNIDGDLVIDESIFDDQRHHPSWEASDLDNWYAAPVGGLNFNDNCIDITLGPSEKSGDLVRVTFLPETSLVKIVNQCRTGGKGTPVLHHVYDSFEYRIRGRCNKRWPFGSVSFPDPGLLFADSLKTVLARNGISLAGTIVRRRVRQPDGALPAKLTVIAERTTSIADVLHRAGKNSQNLFAECLLKRSGVEWAKRVGIADPRGSWTLGARAVGELFDWAGIDDAGLNVADGSGLSRDNVCTARQLAGLLAWIHRRPEGKLLYDSLAVAGVDGSMRKRLKELAGEVRAKTGTMSGVCALAGYVDDDRGAKFAFAVMFNGYKGPSTPYRQIQDEMCRILAAASSPQPVGSR